MLFDPAPGIGSTNESLNIVRHNPDVFIPIATSPIGGKPGLTEVDTLWGDKFYYPVADLMSGLNELDSKVGLDGILLCSIGPDVYNSMTKMTERWPVVWRFNINPLEFTFDPGMVSNIPRVLGLIGMVDAVVPCTEFVEDNLKQLGIENITTIPVCLDTKKECVPAKPTKDLVVSITRISPIKNILYSLLAMGRVVNELPTAEYEIYGQGVMGPHVAGWVKSLGIARISYGGYKPANEVLPKAKVFLQISISENFSLSVLEAMASGIPVVASNIPGHAIGTVYFDSIKQIADEVRRLLTDDALWEKRRKEGLEKVKEFDVGKVVPQYENLFKKLGRLNNFRGGKR